MRELNERLQRFNVIVLLAAGTAGFLGHGFFLPWTGIVPFLFMLLTALSSANMKLADVRALGRSAKPAAATLLVCHMVLPGLVDLFLRLTGMNGAISQGILLAQIMPVGVTAFAWTAMSKGNIGTILAMITISTALSPLTVPFTFALLAGEKVDMDTAGLMLGLVKLVLLPCIAGLLIGRFVPGVGRAKNELALCSKLSLYGIVLLNAASVSGAFGQIDEGILSTIAMIGLLMSAGYVIAWIILYGLKIERSLEIAYTYAGGIRNYTAALVLAQLYLPAAAAVPVMIAMLLQHPAAMLAQLALRFRHERPRYPTTKLKGSEQNSGSF